jgi:glycerol-3-phosphate O-acyltransferase
MKFLPKKLHGLPNYQRHDVIDSILKNPHAQDVFQELQGKKHQPIDESKLKARQILLELSSSYKRYAIEGCFWIVKTLEKLMFDKIMTYGENIGTLQNLVKDNKILFFLPNHKSHMDYLLLSYILYNNGIAPPHIAAGVNLAFFPVGGIFRRTGAYFIRRKIAGNFLYTKMLESYFEWMLQQKICQEFYMEGGRSRDGKIRDAQSGILTLFVEKIQALGLEADIHLVPTSITYDRIPEMGSLLQELRGETKQKENAFSLAQSLSVLTRKYGQVHVHFDHPIALNTLVGNNEFSKKDFHHLSQTVFSKIQQHKIITASGVMALVLMQSPEETKTQTLLNEVNDLMKFLKPCQLCMSEEVVNIQKDFSKILQKYESYGWFYKKGDLIAIEPSKRMEMNYYKNDVLPYLLPYYLKAIENSLHREILMHEFPFASTEEKSSGSSDLLKSAFAPLLDFYSEIQEIITANNMENLVSKDTQAAILSKLIRVKAEMKTTEAVKTASLFFHHRK